ncbi:aminomethyltransferase family protein [Tuwongella immobilis]|uniref:Aminomethyltransferase folate-binding domain-containing protein n=1 Tax=Tuwongella immobilis TaxID=692036 RepID=A0A6C2YN01_9BACT|nr:aminomethyltransferase family protein [Tuwongella immobilis]VIP02589.1 glycine cleavage system protein t : Glycine cleavage T protein, aminomethyl transferase OS=Planctomyces maris DSM 8797 GN=PM8797T_09449 PE=3 SV=1: GCV_T: GCV_T_C [Tuwongella immobilis]VTS01855.1 glycine cleavage system protein t : Glycine cleavage T protein, aminomethyl transferase OS=Planctomyces maris DSM 8797 GN=PM8797T_09449 PE=3 SV=1: GCV_T: GCV_T_C [Tuwongella immobilis]
MTARTPIAAWAQAHGATFGQFAGWEMPAHYGDLAGEYRATLDSAALFDYSYAGKLELSGPDAPSFLGNLSTNDIASLPLGGGCETYFCDHRAKVQHAGWVYRVLLDGMRNGFWLDTTPGRDELLIRHLDRYLISEAVEMVNRTTQFAQFHLAGPRAKAILAEAIGSDLPELDEFLHMERTIGANAVVSLRRHDPLGVPGYDLVCTNERAEAVVRMLVDSLGAQPAGLETYETLRIEAGTPIYGIDIDENRFVMEVANALRAVSYRKGCYLGQEPIVMARDRAGFVNRSFLGMTVSREEPLPAGTKVMRENTEVGIITSSIRAPGRSNAVAIGYLRRGHQDIGTILEADVNGVRVPVTVAGFPVNRS